MGCGLRTGMTGISLNARCLIDAALFCPLPTRCALIHLHKIILKQCEMEGLTRRQQMYTCVAAELAISKAMADVENLGADTRLTDAICKLTEARNLVSDFVDENYPASEAATME